MSFECEVHGWHSVLQPEYLDFSNRVLLCYFSILEPPGVARPLLSQHQTASWAVQASDVIVHWSLGIQTGSRCRAFHKSWLKPSGYAVNTWTHCIFVFVFNPPAWWQRGRTFMSFVMWLSSSSLDLFCPRVPWNVYISQFVSIGLTTHSGRRPQVVFLFLLISFP